MTKAGFTRHFKSHEGEEKLGADDSDSSSTSSYSQSPPSSIGLSMSDLSTDDEEGLPPIALEGEIDTRPRLFKIIPNFEYHSEKFLSYEGPAARLAKLDMETLRAGYLIARLGLSRAEMDVVNDYVDFQRRFRGSAAVDEEPAALPSKKVVERRIMKACDRQQDGMIKRAVFQVPANVPGCQSTEVEFMVSFMSNSCMKYTF